LLDIDRAARVLRAGGLVGFPTETVYGLGADAANPVAVRRIFAAKGRPVDHPVIVHIAGAAQLNRWATDVPAAARVLMNRFWPGPLTLILRRASGVLDEVTGGQDTVGLRAPSHPGAQRLLQVFGGGIAGPSANRFGHISPTTAQHVRDEFGDAVDLVLDGGSCDVGIESTILDLSTGTPVLLRPGHIKPNELEEVLRMPVSRGAAHSPRASGTLEMHYAPRHPLLLPAPEQFVRVVREQSQRTPTAVLARAPKPAGTAVALWQVASNEPREYARDLYAMLRLLDGAGCEVIVVEAPPDHVDWDAVRDRLHRAAAGSGSSHDPL
jgi:L-threonylcarbamoyladenylate synthase